MVVLRSMILVNTPPSVSRPSESGTTSSRSTSDLLPSKSWWPWMAAPTATTSSGINAFVSFFPEDFPHQLLDARHAGHTADEHHFVNVAGFQTSIA
jgi:hypothetical protein